MFAGALKVHRQKLLEHVKANRKKHEEAYKQAAAEYKNQAKEAIETVFQQAQEMMRKKRDEALRDLRSYDPKAPEKCSHYWTISESRYASLAKPVSFLKHYDMAIQLLEWDTREIILLSMAQVRCLVMDRWEGGSELNALSDSAGFQGAQGAQGFQGACGPEAAAAKLQLMMGRQISQHASLPHGDDLTEFSDLFATADVQEEEEAVAGAAD